MKKGPSKLFKNEPENNPFVKRFKKSKLIFDGKRQLNW